MEGKECIECKEWKVLDTFSKGRGECKECRKEYNKKYSEGHKEEIKVNYEKNKKDRLEQMKIYHSKPEVKERRAKYGKDYYEENKKAELEKAKIRNAKPEVKERIAKYHKKYNKEYNIKNGLTTGTGQTILEKIVENWLIKRGLAFNKEFSIENCRNKQGHLLFFDFNIPYFNTNIEIDGIFHFRPIYSNFRKMKTNDQTKNKYCKNNNINLLRISYKQNIIQELDNFFYNKSQKVA